MTTFLGLVDKLQAKLNFGDSRSTHFASSNGAGRHGIAGIIIGWVFGFHGAIILLSLWVPIESDMLRWSIYMILLGIFHFSEWYVTAIYRPSELSYSSWIINHSKAYTLAQFASMIEFWSSSLILHIFPDLRRILYGNEVRWMISIFSFLICIASLIIRVLAMITAGENFNHRIMVFKNSDDQHALVKHGVYAYLRHPSYFGWFYWAVASQVLLLNPLCSIGYFIYTIKFFSQRIYFEETYLVQIYGNDYEEYAKRTPILIPFVDTYISYKLPMFRRKSELQIPPKPLSASSGSFKDD